VGIPQPLANLRAKIKTQWGVPRRKLKRLGDRTVIPAVNETKTTMALLTADSLPSVKAQDDLIDAFS
jgi:hypothetical protein